MLDQLKTSGFGKRFARAMLAFDSFVDSSLYTSGVKARESYDSFAAFMDRFYVGGWRRAVLELCCEGLTLGLGGMILLLAFAMPAFQYTSDDWLKKQDLAVTFLDRYGQEVGKRGIRHDDAVPLEQYPDYLIQAVLATEDRRFYDHWGIDPIGTLRALTVDAGSSGVVEGGSSITQQLAKNLFLSNERTLERKIKEAFLAFWLESHLQKREILQLYLDRAYMGGGTFGIQAASEFYFDKNIRDISLAEAAMLAGLFKAPTKYAPHINLPAARARANDVLSNLVDAGYMTEGQVYAARQNPATPVDRQRESSPDWYLDWAFEQVKGLVDSGKLGNDRVLTVRTALDTNLQQHSESAIEDALRVSGPRWNVKQAATVVLEPNGAVRAIVGGRDYGESQFNRATEAERQPGSSFKPFVYLTALKTGRFNAHSTVDASSICIGNWCPANYGGESAGRIPIAEALAKSINTAAVWLSVKIGEAYWPRGQAYHLARIAQLGRAKIVETAKAMGITTPLPDTVSLPIGADVVKPIDMASAYSVFAAGGKRSPAYAVVEVRNSKGDVIYNHDRDTPPPVQIEPADKVAEMVYLMNQVVQVGTGRAAQLDGITVAGKTGTTNNSRDAWFIGYTGNYVAAVWFGNDDFTGLNGMTGGTLPAATWHNIMAYAHQGIELKPLPGFSTPPGPANVASNQSGSGDLGAPRRPVTLSHKSAAALGDIEQLFHNADQKRQLGLGPVTSPVTLAAGSGAHNLETMR